MKIGVVLWSGDVGGAETWSTALARSFARHGNEVGLLVICGGGQLRGRWIDHIAEIRVLGLSRGVQLFWHLRELAEALSEMSCDIIVTPTCGFLNVAIRLAGFRRVIVAIEHGSLLRVGSRGPVYAIRRWIADAGGFWAVDAQVGPSDFMLNELRRFPHTRITRRIYPGIEIDEVGGPDRCGGDGRDGALRIGYAGRLVSGKGVDVLLCAFAEVRRRMSVSLCIAGDGPMRTQYESQAGRLGVCGDVRFVGWVHPISAFWRDMDIGVVPSSELVESFGMSAIEAMAAGAVVIASRRGGLVEVVGDGECGALVSAGDVGELAAALSRYVVDHRLRQTTAAAGRRRVETIFGIDRCAREFLDLFETIFQMRPAAGMGRD